MFWKKLINSARYNFMKLIMLNLKYEIQKAMIKQL